MGSCSFFFALAHRCCFCNCVFFFRAALELPPPIKSAEVLMGDTPMVAASVSHVDGSIRTVFLPPGAYEQLVHFVQERPDEEPQLLVLVGPVKSGKTTVLHKLLPSIIVSEHGTTRGARPVILRVSFGNGMLPDQAALMLVENTAAIAAPLGVRITMPGSASEALRRLDVFMADLAGGIRANGSLLWLLLDEVQVSGSPPRACYLAIAVSGEFWHSHVHAACPALQAPVLACKTVDDAVLFTERMKSVVHTCSPLARIGITGSRMVTLLNQIRMTRPSGFDFMAAARFVQLGGTPSPAAADAMAAYIVADYAERGAWPREMRAVVTSAALLAKLASARDFVSARPALVAHFVDLIGDAQTRRPHQLVDAAMEALVGKLIAESRVDFLIALQHVDGKIMEALHALAAGKPDDPFNSLHDGPFNLLHVETYKLERFVELLCEPAATGTRAARPLRLLPPYAMLTKECVSADGQLLLRLGSTKEELGEPLRQHLIFFHESYRSHHFDRRLQAAYHYQMKRVG